VQSPKIP